MTATSKPSGKDHIFIGLDTSLNGTGLHALAFDGSSLDHHRVVPPEVYRVEGAHGKRLRFIANEIRNFIARQSPLPSAACIEQGAFNAQSRHHQLGKVLGIAELILVSEYEIPYAFVPATRVKKFATGNGKAEKETLKKAMLRFEPHLPSYISLDESDAYWLARIARFLYLHQHFPQDLYLHRKGPSAYHRKVINNTMWETP